MPNGGSASAGGISVGGSLKTPALQMASTSAGQAVIPKPITGIPQSTVLSGGALAATPQGSSRAGTPRSSQRMISNGSTVTTSTTVTRAPVTSMSTSSTRAADIEKAPATVTLAPITSERVT